MQNHVIRRDGVPPIVFTGEQIAESGNWARNSTRWVSIEIYRTQGGNYVVSVARFNRLDGGMDSRSAASRKTAAEVIDWLKNDDGTLDVVSQEAVERAVKVDPAFAAAWVEKVE